jgi:hypothetical protein
MQPLSSGLSRRSFLVSGVASQFGFTAYVTEEATRAKSTDIRIT